MSDIPTTLLISLRISVLATAAVVAAGLPLAWALAYGRFRGRGALDVAVNLPLAVPPTVLGYYLLLLIARNGPLGLLFRRLGAETLVFTPTAAVLAAAVVSLPLFVQAARNALEDVPHETLEAARVDGAGRLATFRHVMLPLAWPGVWTGALVAYARSLGEFGATLMVAGNIPGRTQTISLAIYSAVQSGQMTEAHLLALLLTGVAALSMWAGLRFRRRPGITPPSSRA